MIYYMALSSIDVCVVLFFLFLIEIQSDLIYSRNSALNYMDTVHFQHFGELQFT